MSALAIEIVDIVMSELERRRGIKQELAQIEGEHPDVYAELKKTLVEKVDHSLACAGH